ncbi:peptidylprolyl isomerase [Leptolyngbya sp. FACHB-541]|uniref:foldase protein PrsA n=1 Tax=Leptolyngbya sp. FACHB-541 TaxID=2692810 RepID=UPI001688F40A|nr:peptidylprolyl isomerase [Leptolyngbya sp. FACHB-541]MBD1998470.1 peptidylprolyl isomerase [Leptolyngbya sp. FACHB-541]
MTSEPFLTVDDQPISLGQAIRYLQTGRKFDAFIGEIIRQFVVDQELQTREDLKINTAAVEQAVIDFRLEQQLTDPKQFQEWLSSNGMDYETFHNQVSSGFKLRKLKEDVALPKLQEYFIERKIFLDRVVLSRIIVVDKELAEELRSQILEEGAKFEQLAREYSLTDDRIVNGMVGPISRGTMPDTLRAAVDLAKSGEIVGPLGMEDRWGLFRVEEFLPASLDDLQLRQTLVDELFEQWLMDKIQGLPIKLQVGS